MVICLERGADLHTAQLMPLPLTVYCFSKIQIGFTFLVPADLGSPGQRAVKWVCVCMCMNFVHTVAFYNYRYRYLQFVAIYIQYKYCIYMCMNFVHSCV